MHVFSPLSRLKTFSLYLLILIFRLIHLSFSEYLPLKYARRKIVKGSIWQKDNPFTEEQNRENYSLTWLFSSGDLNRLNTDFQGYVKNKEDGIKCRLKLNNIEDAPEDVLDAIDRYRKEVCNKILADLRGKGVAPSMAIFSIRSTS